VTTIRELLTSSRAQDDEPRLAPGSRLRVLHRLGPDADPDQVVAIARAQRHLGLNTAVDTAAAPATARRRRTPPVDVVHVHGARDDAGLQSLARVVVLGPRSSRLPPLDANTQVVAETRQHAAALVRRGAAATSVHVVLPLVIPAAERLTGGRPLRSSRFVVGLLAARQPAPWVEAANGVLLPVLARRPRAELWLAGVAGQPATASWIPARQAPAVRRMHTLDPVTISQLDIVVCLDQSVVLPAPLLAAMQLGRPIVASRIGAAREVLDNGVSALLVNPGDTTALASSVSRLIARPLVRSTLGGAAQTAALQHSPRRVADRLAQLYERLVAADATHPAGTEQHSRPGSA